MSECILLPILLVWLLACMIFDLRARSVPGILTLYPLVIAGGHNLVQGQWMAALLLVILIFLSDREPRGRRVLVAVVVATCAAMVLPTTAPLLFALLGIWLLWEIGAMGGADAKLLMTLALLVGFPWLFALIALAGGVQGLLALLTGKKSVPYVVAIFSGTALYTLNQLWTHLL